MNKLGFLLIPVMLSIGAIQAQAAEQAQAAKMPKKPHSVSLHRAALQKNIEAQKQKIAERNAQIEEARKKRQEELAAKEAARNAELLGTDHLFVAETDNETAVQTTDETAAETVVENPEDVIKALEELKEKLGDLQNEEEKTQEQEQSPSE